jgi:spore coat protein U-like protein
MSIRKMKNVNKILYTCAAVLAYGSLSGAAMALDTHTLTVSASVSGVCKFSSSSSTLSFGALDPSSNSNATASGSTTFWCTKGTAYSVADDDGLHETAVNANRMQHSTDTTEYIPYTLTYTPTSGTGAGPTAAATLSFAGAIQYNDYKGALAGSYSDTVTVTVTP